MKPEHFNPPGPMTNETNGFYEDKHPGRVVRVARQMARELREAKSDHDWTMRECGLLSELCDILGVDRHPDPRPKKKGSVTP